MIAFYFVLDVVIHMILLLHSKSLADEINDAQYTPSQRRTVNQSVADDKYTNIVHSCCTLEFIKVDLGKYSVGISKNLYPTLSDVVGFKKKKDFFTVG